MKPRTRTNETPSAGGGTDRKSVRRRDTEARSSTERPAPANDADDDCDEIGPDGGYGGTGLDQTHPRR
jgi:hypothetical protein